MLQVYCIEKTDTEEEKNQCFWFRNRTETLSIPKAAQKMVQMLKITQKTIGHTDILTHKHF